MTISATAMKVALLFTLLVWASPSQAQVSFSGGVVADAAAPCTQTCATQVFTGDPFDADERFTQSVSPAGENCDIDWDSTNGRLERRIATSSSSCDHSTALARFNGDISEDGCALFQIVESDDGTGNHDLGFEPGMVLRHQKPDVGDDPSGLFTSTENNGALVARCETGLNCTSLRLAHIGVFEDLNLTCDTFGALAVGDWFGVCIRGTTTDGLGTVKVFNLGSTDPGDPATTDGGAGWATADPDPCVFTVPCQAGAGVCDDSGNYWGVWMRTNDVTTGAVYSVDNFRTYSCQPAG